MGFLTSIRSSLLFVSFTAIAIIMWLSVSFLFAAYLQRVDAAQLLESIETVNSSFETSRVLSRQRALLHTIFSRVDAADDNQLDEISSLQKELRSRYSGFREKINSAMIGGSLSNRYTFANSEISDIYDDVNLLFGKLSSEEAWILEQASLPLTQRDAEIKERIVNQLSSLLESMQLMRLGIHFVPRNNYLHMNHLQVLRADHWRFRDAFSREALVLSNAISLQSNLRESTKNDIELLHLQTLAAWQAVKQYKTKRGAISVLFNNIVTIEKNIFNELTQFRDVSLNSENQLNKDSVVLEKWSYVVLNSLSALDDLDKKNGEQIIKAAIEVESRALRKLYIDMAVVFVCMLIGIAVIGVLRKIRYLATHDNLTGLPNRICFESHLTARLQRSKTDPVAVMLIDLDGFKHVNDTLGHEVGDKLLHQVSWRMRECVASPNVVARLGGDEFSVVLDECASEDSALKTATAIIEAIAKEFDIDGFRVRIGASIGLSFLPEDASSADELKRHADFAMYSAKLQGRNRVCAYDQTIATEYQQRLQLKDDLKHAVDDHQFELVYQPQIGINAGEVLGLEALIRWHHPTNGLISPDTFIPIAEESGQILEIGDWVLEEACRQMALWHVTGLPNMKIAVNVSAMQFMRADFIDCVVSTCKRHCLNPASLELEITESVLVTDVQRVVDTCYRLRELKIKVAIDDFGTGYSSLSYLQELPVDTLKIDRAFVAGLDGATSKSVARTIVTLARACGLETVAEGVETEAQATMIAELGCDYIQGYLYSKPVSASELVQQVALINDYCMNNSSAA